MKLILAFAALLCLADTEPPPICIPQHDIDLIKTADDVKVTGTNDSGGAEDFAINDPKAIRQFVELLTSERYVPVPKNTNPQFKSLSRYNVQLFSKGTLVFQLQIVAISVLDIPGDDQFYMESSRYSEVLLAPLLRLRR